MSKKLDVLLVAAETPAHASMKHSAESGSMPGLLKTGQCLDFSLFTCTAWCKVRCKGI